MGPGDGAQAGGAQSHRRLLELFDRSHDHDREHRRRDLQDQESSSHWSRLIALPIVVGLPTSDNTDAEPARFEPYVDVRREPDAPPPAEQRPRGDLPPPRAVARLPELADGLERLHEVRERDEPPADRPARREAEAAAGQDDGLLLGSVLPDAPQHHRGDEHQGASTRPPPTAPSAALAWTGVTVPEPERVTDRARRSGAAARATGSRRARSG